MNRLNKTVMLLLLFTPLMSLAQDKKVCVCSNGCITTPSVPVVNKGYYSIGNNAEKLAKCPDCCTQEGSVKVEKQLSNKGYYAIGNNSTKLQAGKRSTGLNRVKPPVQKGYYAIGNNYTKLQKQQPADGKDYQCNCN